MPKLRGIVEVAPPPEGRALHRMLPHAIANITFQSSPFPKEGRYCTTSPEPENTGFGPGFREPAFHSPKQADRHVT